MSTTASGVGALLARGGRSFSFELFPPKTDEGEQQLWATVAELEPLHPTFVSITYGAGGSTRDRTVRICAAMASQTAIVPVAHLTCVGASRAELEAVIDQYLSAGVTTILALRGDPPGGPGHPWREHPDGFSHADELVRLIRSQGSLSVGVAAFPEGHPESASLDDDARVLAMKQDAGAEFAVTQFFFRARDYEDLVRRARSHGCTMPIVPGLMPVTNVAQIERFAQLSGAEFPPEMARAFADISDDAAAVQDLGVAMMVDLGAELLAMDAPGLHFYTLNRSTSTMRVYEALGLAAIRA